MPSSWSPCFHVRSLHAAPKPTTEILIVSPAQNVHSLPTMLNVKSNTAPWSTKSNLSDPTVRSVVSSPFFLPPVLPHHSHCCFPRYLPQSQPRALHSLLLCGKLFPQVLTWPPPSLPRLAHLIQAPPETPLSLNWPTFPIFYFSSCSDFHYHLTLYYIL